jgi:hypothetical protein
MNSNNVHSHSISDPGHAHTFTQPFGPVNTSYSGGGQGLFGGGNYTYGTDGARTNISINGVDINHTHGYSGTTDNGTGTGTAFSTISPYLGINFIIKT